MHSEFGVIFLILMISLHILGASCCHYDLPTSSLKMQHQVTKFAPLRSIIQHTHNTPTHTHTQHTHTHTHTHMTVVMLSCSHDGWTLLSCFHLALLKLLTAHSHTFLDEHTYPLRLTHSNSTHPHFFCVTSSTTPHTLINSQSNPHLSPPLHHPATQSLTPSSSNFRIFRFLCSTLCLFLI